MVYYMQFSGYNYENVIINYLAVKTVKCNGTLKYLLRFTAILEETRNSNCKMYYLQSTKAISAKRLYLSCAYLKLSRTIKVMETKTDDASERIEQITKKDGGAAVSFISRKVTDTSIAKLTN